MASPYMRWRHSVINSRLVTYCLNCMASFGANQSCPTNGPGCQVVDVKRRLHGWVGLRRYLHEEDFGLDIIRNGHIIEVLNKHLFVWAGGDRPERKYPIDDQWNQGRFIGAVHLDHCSVSYTKDRFERGDTAWTEMISLVRGEGQLQPQSSSATWLWPSRCAVVSLVSGLQA